MKKLARFFAELYAKIKQLFVGIPKQFKEAVRIAVVVTETFKTIVDSPVADILTALIPGDADDRIKILIRQKLPEILATMRLIETTAKLESKEDLVKAAMEFIQSLPKSEQNRIYHDLAVRVAELTSDGELSLADSIYLVQWYYDHQLKK